MCGQCGCIFLWAGHCAETGFFHGFEPRLSILHVAWIMLGGMAQSHAVGGGATIGPGTNRYFGWAYFDIAERLWLPYHCPRTLEVLSYQLLFFWPFWQPVLPDHLTESRQQTTVCALQPSPSGTVWMWKTWRVVHHCCLILQGLRMSGGNGILWGRSGSWSLFVSGSVVSSIPAIFVWVGGITMGFGKFAGNIPKSIQAALLKYRRWILLHIYRACLVFRPWIVNSTGSQPWHVNVKPPAAWTIFRDGMRLFSESPIFFRCLGLPRHMVAPLSGKIIALILWGTLILSGVWRWWGGGHECLYLCHLACPFVCVCTHCLVKCDMCNESVHASFISFRVFCSCSPKFFSSTHIWEVVGLSTIVAYLTPCWAF